MTNRPVYFRYAVFAGLVCVGVFVALLTGLFSGAPRPEEIWAAYQAGGEYEALEITYPLDGALFPPEIIAPTFRWKDRNAEVDTWLVWIEFEDKKDGLSFLASKEQWTPSDEQWEGVKHRSRETEARASIVGVNRAAPGKILSAGEITISTSKDEVGAPLFYREVNLPFIDAVKDPRRIRWRFGEISSKTQPPIVLEKLPVCGNCHSFSADGTVLGMDVDYANDRGSYAIAPVAEKIVLDNGNIITWSDYKKDDGRPTFGLLSQVSPCGKCVVSTVKDRSVFVPKPDLEFSQLFFPIHGILAVYYRQSGEFHALPGADDPSFVQSNATWSPDGKTIVFARSKVHPLKTDGNNVLLTEEEAREFLKEGRLFLFDLYRIPFNDGKGGKAEPIEGASSNGMSNFFPKYSPDGKWIVFCKAKSYMLLQPDSELYIMPAGGGEARRMRCNTSRMNSWHSWSPNSKWLVFSSKENGPYTQLWLTHIDQQGRSTAPVLLENFTAKDRAANIPEFVDVELGAIMRISQKFVDDHSLIRAGHGSLHDKDFDDAARSYREALEINPNNAEAYRSLGFALSQLKGFKEAIECLRKSLEIEPKNAYAHTHLGNSLLSLGRIDEGIGHFRTAVEIDPECDEVYYNLATVLTGVGKLDEAIKHFRKTVEINPRHAFAHYNLGLALCEQGKIDEGAGHYRKTLEIKPDHAPTHNNLATALCQLGRFDEGIKHFRKALEIDPTLVDARMNLEHVLRSRD